MTVAFPVHSSYSLAFFLNPLYSGGFPQRGQSSVYSMPQSKSEMAYCKECTDTICMGLPIEYLKVSQL